MLVHNGIIENYLELRGLLTEQGYSFLSQTDTEVAACYLDYCYHGDPIDAIREALNKIEGAYAFVIMFSDHPDTIYAIRKDGPLLAALGDGENFVASDITAVISYTNRYFVLDEGEISRRHSAADPHPRHGRKAPRKSSADGHLGHRAGPEGRL